MNLAPKNWTHHHTHRMFHLLMLTHIVLIVTVILSGVVTMAWQVRGASEDVLVTGEVGTINPGPSGGGGGGVPIDIPPPTQFPAVTSCTSGSETGGVFSQGGRSYRKLTTNQPKFFGQTNVLNAIVSLDIDATPRIIVLTHANKTGNWEWLSTEMINGGAHHLLVRVRNSLDPSITASCDYYFYIEPSLPPTPGPTPAPTPSPTPAPTPTPPGQPTPTPTPRPTPPPPISTIPGSGVSVLVTIPDTSKQIQPGDELLAQIRIINFDKPIKPQEFLIEYSITDSTGKVIMENSETVRVGDELNFTKTFYTQATLKPGDYKLNAKITTKSVVTLSTDGFTVRGPAIISLGNGKVDYTIIFEFLLALLLLFCFIAYLEYTKISMLTDRIRQIDEWDLLPDIKKKNKYASH